MSSKVSRYTLLFWYWECLSQKESRLDSLLHSKARSGDFAGVQQVLDSGRVDPDCRDQVGHCYLNMDNCLANPSGWNHSSHVGSREREGEGYFSSS